jgi:hypothetical protein
MVIVKDEKRPYKFWTTNEVETMKKLYINEGYTSAEIADVLLRTVSSVRDKLHKEGIKKGFLKPQINSPS